MELSGCLVILNLKLSLSKLEDSGLEMVHAYFREKEKEKEIWTQDLQGITTYKEHHQ